MSRISNLFAPLYVVPSRSGVLSACETLVNLFGTSGAWWDLVDAGSVDDLARALSGMGATGTERIACMEQAAWPEQDEGATSVQRRITSAYMFARHFETVVDWVDSVQNAIGVIDEGADMARDEVSAIVDYMQQNFYEGDVLDAFNIDSPHESAAALDEALGKLHTFDFSDLRVFMTGRGG